MDINAHLKVEMVLNGEEEEEDEEEKRFNEIICYDSGDSCCEESNENSQSDFQSTQFPKSHTSLKNTQQNLGNELPSNPVRIGRNDKKSNAAQMRKYRAKQRSDPIKYQQYLERERTRNYKRKYEKRIEEAQERAQSLGIPFIVLDPPKRGSKRMFGDVSLVLPAKFDDDIEYKSNSFISDDMPKGPVVKAEWPESEERKPQISVVNINKLMSQPRSALQTLLPEEVNDRVSNFIKMEHGYVKQEKLSKFDGEFRKRSRKNKRKMSKRDLLQLQEQCRSFILDRTIGGELPKPKPQRNRRQRQRQLDPYRHPTTSHSERRNCVEHEDLDDLFKELAEVATKEPPKKKHSSSTHKKSSAKHSPRKQSFVHGLDDGHFSLTVSMPVQPIAKSTIKCVSIKEEPNGPWSPCNGDETDEYKITSMPNNNLDAF